MKRVLFVAISVIAGLCLASCTSKNSGMEPTIDNYYGNYYEGEGEPQSGDRFEEFADNPFINASEQPQSTFSVDADGASYAYMRNTLRHNMMVNPSAVRIEEFLNYFTFDYADPTGDETVAINGEIGTCPWNSEHRLMRLGIKGTQCMKENRETISRDNFKEFVKSIHLIITTELNEKGVGRKWNK